MTEKQRTLHDFRHWMIFGHTIIKKQKNNTSAQKKSKARYWRGYNGAFCGFDLFISTRGIDIQGARGERFFGKWSQWLLTGWRMAQRIDSIWSHATGQSREHWTVFRGYRYSIALCGNYCVFVHCRGEYLVECVALLRYPDAPAFVLLTSGRAALREIIEASIRVEWGVFGML